MKLTCASGLAALIAAMVALPVTAAAASTSCGAGRPAPASYTWNFHAEASRLLSGIQAEAAKAQNRAATLDSYALDSNVDWQLHASQLAALKHEVDGMGRKLCRLEQIRRVTAPWQQKAIADAAPMVQLMADNVQDAIAFLNQHEGSFWEPASQLNISNVLNESGQLSRSVKNFEQYAKVHREDLQLKKGLGAGRNS
jgi:hypothetical protein